MAHMQGNYLKQCKAQIDVYEAVLLAEYAENYQFVIQNEEQSYHWCKNYCTIYIVIYMKDECNYLKSVLTCFISDFVSCENKLSHCKRSRDLQCITPGTMQCRLCENATLLAIKQ